MFTEAQFLDLSPSDPDYWASAPTRWAWEVRRQEMAKLNVEKYLAGMGLDAIAADDKNIILFADRDRSRTIRDLSIRLWWEGMTLPKLPRQVVREARNLFGLAILEKTRTDDGFKILIDRWVNFSNSVESLINAQTSAGTSWRYFFDRDKMVEKILGSSGSQLVPH